MYIFELLTNPNVIGTIMGAIIGAVTSTVFALVISQYKFNKRKKGAKALLKSELNYIIYSLEEFRDKHLKGDELIGYGGINKAYNFYDTMSYYPKLNNKNWINLITFIPSIFDEEKINIINQFYAKYEELSDTAKVFSDKLSHFNDTARKNLSHDKIIMQRNGFKNDLDELIILGNKIQCFTKYLYHFIRLSI